ncbi:hypothetical protein INT46_003285 [Mucor plumbeus]|uniref:BZIP domain-containing protein n=1 Tax=Mucor plumbeus TaxID=97098 RepID=A0A8H7QJ06_9FUNG|nr:hypothetical protein INT46_003285 [Mucor plumbeus]
MDQIDLNSWLTGDDDIMDTLVGLASIPEEPSNNRHIQQNSGADILEYLLQTGNVDSNNSIFHPINVQHNTQPPPPATTTTDSTNPVHTSATQQTNQVTEQQPPAPNPIVITDAMFRDSVSVIQEKDNFVTFLPHSKPANKKQNAPKKAKFKEPIFVTESPQSYKKKSKANVGNTSNHSSAEDNSDDDMMLEDELSSSNPNNSNLKQMTSKERRQLRNKISARNFRVRRKEYITQLEEKVADHEKTINDLKKENEKLRKVNQDIMKQLLVQPITPPSSSGDELLSASSSSGSEGHNSPDAQPPAYQFQLNDLYDFNLFDQQAQHAQQQQQQQPQYPNLFYLNHATMPDWDMTQVLSEKDKSITTEEYQRELSRELINDYPLLAPALMSIVLRHTLSLEYVTALAKEFSDKVGADLVGSNHSESKYTDEDKKTLCGVDIDDLKSSFNSLNIEDKEDSEVDDTEEKTEFTDLDVIKIMLTKHFSIYIAYRARGFTFEEIIAKCRLCIESNGCSSKGKQKANSIKDTNKSNGMQTLQAYCRVAGNLLRHPHRMTHVSDVLKKEIAFPQNKQTVQVQSLYKSLFSPQKSRIAN